MTAQLILHKREQCLKRERERERGREIYGEFQSRVKTRWQCILAFHVCFHLNGNRVHNVIVFTRKPGLSVRQNAHPPLFALFSGERSDAEIQTSVLAFSLPSLPPFNLIFRYRISRNPLFYIFKKKSIFDIYLSSLRESLYSTSFDSTFFYIYFSSHLFFILLSSIL